MSDFLGEVGRRDEPMRSATVLSVTNSRAKIELSTGAVIPSALLVGATYAGAHVRVAYQDGQYVVYGSGGSGMPSVSVGASSVGGTSVVGGTPSPHDWLGSHHTLPSGAAGLFAATPASSSGAVSMRAMALSDFQGAADTRYALQSTAITAGAGLTGNGTLGASFTLAVGAGDGIAADTDAVRVRRATTSGLSFSSGELAVGAGAGISVLTSTVAVNQAYAFGWSGVHTHSARPVFGAGATVSAGQTLRIGSGTGDVDLSRKASDVLALGSGDAMESTSYQSGVSGWRIGADGAAEFGNVRIRGELAAAVFRFNEVSATAGTFGVYYSASVVHADFTTPAATNTTVSGVQIKNATPASTTALFASGDRLQVRAWNGTALVAAWFTVDAAPTTATGYSTYTLRLQSGSTSALVPSGTAIVDWGAASGGGAVTLSADGTIGAAPNISTQTTAGSPWSDAALRARLGNLNGSYGYSADTFGFAAGNSAATFVAVDSNNGFRVVRDTTTRFQVDTAGALTIRNAAGSAVITMDSTSARIDNVLNIGTSGEIRQGAGSLTASPATFTGLRVWSELSSGNYFGRIGGYNSGTLQWHAATDGTLKAGGGDVTLDSDGISLVSWVSSRGSLGSVNGYRFSANSTTFCGLYAFTDGTVQTTVSLLNYGATQPDIKIEAQDTSTSGGSYSAVTITASGPSYSASARLDANAINLHGKGLRVTSTQDFTAAAAGTLYTSGSTTVAGGLNVGAATAATTGQLYMQGNSTKLVATNAQNGSAAFTLEYESGTTISRKGYLQFATNATSPFNADLTFVSQSFGERVKFEGNTGNMLVHAGGNSNRPAAPRDTLHLNKQGTGAQTHGMTLSSNDTDVAEFFWSSSGAAIVQALNGNDSVLLQPAGTGRVRAAGLLTVEGDGTGAASTVGFSNVTNGVSTGNGTVKVNGATARDSVGWLKIYVGTAVRYIPYWATITG
jgi:hypothetical protein